MNDEVLRRVAALEERLAAIESRLGAPVVNAAPAAEAAPVAPASPEVPQPAVLAETPPASAPTPRPSRDLESWIGGEWLNRLGIVALLFGVAYFLRYAADRGWIGPVLRVLIGIGIGVAALVVAEIFHRRTHVLFAHGVRVVGVGSLLLSIWAASALYGLIDPAAGFVAMALVVAGLVWLALRHDSRFLASLALSSGFLAPLLLWSSTGDTAVVFGWVALLNIAMLVLIRQRAWAPITVVGFCGTCLVMLVWMAATYETSLQWTATAIAFGLLVTYLLVPLVSRSGSSVVYLALPILNAAFFLAAVTVIWQRGDRLSVVLVAAGAIHVAIAGLFRLRRPALGGVAAELRLLAILFVTIAVPLAFEGITIAIIWAIEAALLLATTASSDQAAKIAGGIVLALGVVALFVTDNAAFQPILNERTIAYAIIISMLARAATRSEAIDARLCAMGAALLGWRYVTLETFTTVGEFAAIDRVRLIRDFSLSAVWIAYAALLLGLGFARKRAELRWFALVLFGSTVLKVFVWDLSQLDRLYRIGSFVALGLVLLAVSFAYQTRRKAES